MFPHEAFEKSTNITCYTVDKKFQSKKNEVYKVTCIEDNTNFNKGLIVKKYLQSHLNFENEVHLLTELHRYGLSVPRVFRVEEKCIIMEYIEGKTLADVLYESEVNSEEGRLMQYKVKKYLTGDLLFWLKNFYQYTKIIRGKNLILKDIHLRNFIFGDSLVGVDFENCCEGKKEEDIGKLCAFIATYDPPWTTLKMELIEEMVGKACEILSLDEDILMLEIDKELTAIKKRRKNT
ncbi:RIO1 family regulatory kinase/ATPase domain-containing protein [Alkaliphilus peptidifermentans]|uniref:non-specific serine/threonine protein kinase n=1 Tax=Alkaliphilus peptidifermentans DSM 18978 TaxID=1120976 RepID=A0A1G5GLC3_9FIRM|nr:RIO1 family regulatory kinase/ATPase [Alkaliphilus peptidifermentans]SCY52020.1 tRNA A-37 threonylcarbamoyl transferase component Bud32 [Alkaliphilus peptidifermentans DSM 18978]